MMLEGEGREGVEPLGNASEPERKGRGRVSEDFAEFKAGYLTHKEYSELGSKPAAQRLSPGRRRLEDILRKRGG